MLGKATFYNQKMAELSSNNETNKNEHHSKSLRSFFSFIISKLLYNCYIWR